MNHLYGPNVKFFDKPALLDILGKLCSPEMVQPQINHAVEFLYRHLLTEILNEEMASETVHIKTRMNSYHPDILLETKSFISSQKAVTVNLARAGTFPSHILYELLHLFLEAKNIRQDHIFAARKTDQDNKVVNTLLDGFKIGGSIEDSMVFIPDPMGATGNTIISTVSHYKKYYGNAKQFVAIHLIVTPEYLRKVLEVHPDIHIYAIRIDRGLSEDKVLKSTPGQFWELEKGLNQNDYIVPGGGGFGEIMNNSFV